MGIFTSAKFHARTIKRDILNEPLNRGHRLRLLKNYFIWQLFEKRHKSKIITLHNGYKSIVKPVPDNDAGEIGIWTLNMDHVDTQFIRTFLVKGDQIVDAGCNVGNRTLALADLLSGALLIDAGRNAVERTRENLELNSLDLTKFVVLHKAVGEHEGVIRFTDFGGASTQNKVIDDGDLSVGGNVVEVSMTTIDKEVAALGIRPAFIKTDVEGHDLSALKGAIQTLKSGSVKIVKFEHISTDPLEPILSFFGELGWKVFSLDAEGKPSFEHSKIHHELNLFAVPDVLFHERFGK
ncbi:MAG: FkbM family methyltransferase [Chitinophagaceae bacterium]